MGVKAVKVDLIKSMPTEGVSKEEEMNIMKYLRGEAADLEVVKDKKLKGQLAVKEHFFGKSAQTAAKIEKWLMPSKDGYLEAEGIEKTWRIRQDAIAHELDPLSLRKQFDIVLPDLGPYTMDFTLSGRHMVAAGRKGHLALVDMNDMSLIKEFQVRETVRDVVFLHNQKFIAAAQKKYVYMYSDNGTELHCLKEHGSALKLQFLDRHFLLTSINKQGQLHYQDITTGQMIGNFKTGLGRSDTMQVNTFNNVVAVGHSVGTVTMWKPTTAAPLVKMLCHKGPITALAFHSNGHLMATAGMEKKIKIWDLRKFGVIKTIPGHANTMDFSQKGLLATATGSFVQILKDFSDTDTHDDSRYMGHSIAKGYQIRNVSFRPYEDALAIGHSMGWSSIVIPGSAVANFDSWLADPFETRKQRNEKEVRSLLDKLPPESIMLDQSAIGSIRPPTRKTEQPTRQEREAVQEAAIEGAKSVPLKKKTKGRSKPSKVAKKKREIVAKAKKPFLEQQAKEDEVLKKKRKRNEGEVDLPKSLQRFARKPTT